jgi:hypothetical protein
MRNCGECNLCCKLLPMQAAQNRATGPAAQALVGAGFMDRSELVGMLDEFDKPAGARCPHQRHHKGCSVYARRPFGCRVWNCRWLVNDDAADLSRPDRAHYVIDIMPDVIRMNPNDGSPPTDVPAIQVWVDPDYPDAHRDPVLRAWLLRRFEKERAVALIRYDNRRGFALIPPQMTGGDWVEARDNNKVMERDDILQHPDQWRPSKLHGNQ